MVRRARCRGDRAPVAWALVRALTFALVPLLASIAPAVSAAPPKPYTGDALPAFTLRTLEGEPYDLAGYRGEIVLVNFWASWCRPCIREMPSMQRLAARLADEPFSVITVNMGEGRESVATFVDELDLALTVLIDVDGSVTRDWGVFAYPSTFLVGVDGRVTHVRYGEAEWDDPAVLALIGSILP